MKWIRRLLPIRSRRSYEIVDPRPNLALAPYTFFLPSESELSHVGTNDLVKITIRGIPSGAKWDAERMLVRVTERNGEKLIGTLENVPDDTPQLKHGQKIEFCTFNIMSIVWAKPELAPVAATKRQYWKRCFVDQCILDGEEKVCFLYRETPEVFTKDDKYPDSGWRIRADQRQLTDLELEKREGAYVALGAVLNKDDSWLHLIDKPIGRRFYRNLETGIYSEVTI